MFEWRKISLGEICKTNTTSYSNKEGWKFVNYLDTGSITGNEIEEIQYIDLTAEKLPSRAKRKVRYNSIVYSTVRPNQLHYGIIKEQPDNFLVSTGFTVIDVDENVADAEYVYYWLIQSVVTEQLQALAEQSTSAYPSIKSSDLEALELELPPLKIQKMIAGILVALDKKRKNNTQINRNLLEQAITVFKEKIWIKDKNGTIGDYCVMKSGFAFKSSWWTEEGVKVIKIGDINQDNLSLNTCSHVDEYKVKKASDYIVKSGDLVLAMTGATIGKFAMVPERKETILVNQRVGKFFLGDEPLKKVPFIYCTLKMDDVYGEVIGRGQGSAQPNISGNDVMTIPCVIPTEEEIDAFNLFAEPIFTSIVKNQNENEQLAYLRDSLLPKLMSGELDVSGLEI